MTSFFHRDGSPAPENKPLILRKSQESGHYLGRPYCSRCGGTGVYKWWTSRGEAAGTCFLCGGEPKPEKHKVYTRKRLDALNKAEATRSLERKRKALAKQVESHARAERCLPGTMELYGELVHMAFEGPLATPDSFLHKFSHRVEESLKEWGTLTPRMVTLLDRLLAEAYVEHATKARSFYIGEEGQRIEVEGVIEKVISFDTQYGTTFITVIRTPEGASLKQMGAFIGQEGDRVSGKTTVKLHEEYKGERQTRVCRSRFEVEETEELV